MSTNSQCSEYSKIRVYVSTHEWPFCMGFISSVLHNGPGCGLALTLALSQLSERFSGISFGLSQGWPIYIGNMQ